MIEMHPFFLLDKTMASTSSDRRSFFKSATLFPSCSPHLLSHRRQNVLVQAHSSRPVSLL